MRPKRQQAGFSMIELVIVLAVILIIIAISVPTMKSTIATYRLDASGHAAASLLQQARIQAVKSNTPYYAQFDTTTTPNMVFANAGNNGYAAGNSMVTVDGDVSLQTTGLPDHQQLDDLLSNQNTSAVANIGIAIGFNSRGLPCTEPGTNPAVCTQPGLAANYFEWFMQSATTGGWEAVTVTPAGRTKAWRLVSTSGGCGGNATVTYTGCWQ
ncbi:MAG TPA: prepilin-type N-terminal cleavage/methylation domain-containing protein [Verrucomicrobiae bacterium]|nr:prepilin-type N-terminal cleavage/methylation domain-containing protein [Verrucomicrobiae bacterium]